MGKVQPMVANHGLYTIMHCAGGMSSLYRRLYRKFLCFVSLSKVNRQKRSPWHLKPFCRGFRKARRTTETLFKRTTSLQILVEISAFQKIPNMSTWIVKEEDVEYFHLMELKKNRESRLWIFQRRKHHIASTKRQNKQVQNIYSERSRQTLRRTRILSNFKLLKQK